MLRRNPAFQPTTQPKTQNLDNFLRGSADVLQSKKNQVKALLRNRWYVITIC